MSIAAGGYHTVALIGSPAPFEVRRSSNELIFTWSTNATGFILQSTPDLTDFDSPITWLDVPMQPTISDEHWTLTNTLSEPARFFRLVKP